MILQRLARDLKERDWGAAAIEIAIVVVGIFIGLQVDDWNNERKDRIAEREYLERLHADFERLVSLQGGRIDVRLDILEDLAETTDLLTGRAPIEGWADEHCDAIANSHIYSPLATAVPVLNEMLATGAVGLLSDIELRDQLSNLQIQVSRSSEMVARIGQSVKILSRAYPDAVWETAVPDDDEGPFRHRDDPRCNRDAVFGNHALVSDFVDNYSRYRAYVSTGLTDTHEQFKRVHDRLDTLLGISHGNPGGAVRP